jgi:hypothetical protein
VWTFVIEDSNEGSLVCEATEMHLTALGRRNYRVWIRIISNFEVQSAWPLTPLTSPSDQTACGPISVSVVTKIIFITVCFNLINLHSLQCSYQVHSDVNAMPDLYVFRIYSIYKWMLFLYFKAYLIIDYSTYLPTTCIAVHSII